MKKEKLSLIVFATSSSTRKNDPNAAEITRKLLIVFKRRKILEHLLLSTISYSIQYCLPALIFKNKLEEILEFLRQQRYVPG